MSFGESRSPGGADGPQGELRRIVTTESPIDRERAGGPRDRGDRAEVVGSGEEAIQRASRVLREGGLVAIPTETVYGLAASTDSPEAVERIFKVKGRPVDHPLIVHIARVDDLHDWAREVPDEAAAVAEAFWPGPLTLVLPCHPTVPSSITGGLKTVALRIPSHPVATGILETLGGGIVAPSANRFGRVSPTTAADVLSELGAGIDLVVDGGPCSIGVESTILEVGSGSRESGLGPESTILRPGGLGVEALEEVLGHPVSLSTSGRPRAPGMLDSHYSPRIPLRICEQDEVAAMINSLTEAGRRVGVLAPERIPAPGADYLWEAGGDVELLARSLYRWLREADDEGLDVLIAVPPRGGGLGTAVRDRLARAAHR